jgi:hypothetical protein
LDHESREKDERREKLAHRVSAATISRLSVMVNEIIDIKKDATHRTAKPSIVRDAEGAEFFQYFSALSASPR